MDDIIFKYISKPKLRNPILIQGLPGIGNVGKLAAEHLLEEVKAKRFAEIFSKYFPPQVLVNDDGTIKLVNNELYYYRSDKENRDDLIILVGDYQGFTPEGQYELADAVLKAIKEFGVKRIFTLGGYSTGKLVEKPRVFGAATDAHLVENMKKLGVMFQKGDSGSGIVGATGLLLGLGKLYDMDSICLMGETSGYFVDPKSSEAVLKVLTKALRIEIDYAKLETKASEVDKLTSKLKDMEMPPTAQQPKKEDLGYIG